MTLLEQTLKNQMRNLGLSCEQLSVLSGVRQTKLIPGLSCRVPLHNEDIDRVRRALHQVRQLVDFFAPIPLDVTNTNILRFLIRKLECGELDGIFTPRLTELNEELHHLLSKDAGVLAAR